MSRKSRPDEPGTVRDSQVAPPSVVRSTVPADPLAQATAALTTLIPRSLAVVPLDCSVQAGSPATARGGTSRIDARHAAIAARRTREPHAGSARSVVVIASD